MLAAALAGVALIAASAPARGDEPSVHQRELDAHRDDAPVVRRMPAATRLAAGRAKAVRRVVYGYYPYWVADLEAIRWEALTHLAWFSVELGSTGVVTARHGWPDSATVTAAHAAGVRVDLTFTLFSGSGILALTSDPARRATAVDTMIDELEAGGADGLAIDFEGLIDGTRAHFTAFITELRAGLDARGHEGAEISIAGPAVNRAGADGLAEFDLPALLDQVDYFFIMGYGYYWSGSPVAGPSGALRTSADWRAVQALSAQRSIAEYARAVGASRRGQILHGVPYYGDEWITADGTVRSPTSSHVGSVTYSAAQLDLSGGRTRLFDEGVASPWYAWEEAGAWHQIWYEDAESLDAKYQLVLEQELGGIGIWALNYDRPDTALWDLIEDRFGAEPAAVPGDRHAPLAIATWPFHDDRSTAAAPGNYFDFYACAPTKPEYGREWVYQIELCQPGRLDAAVAVEPGSGVDVDIHLLDALDEAACLARDDAAISVEVPAGTYYLVADTFVRDQVTAEGVFGLDVTFTADDDAGPCEAPPPPPSCDGGKCDDPGADAGPGGAADPDGLGDAGCGCQSGGSGGATSAAAFAFALALVLSRRRDSRRRAR